MRTLIKDTKNGIVMTIMLALAILMSGCETESSEYYVLTYAYMTVDGLILFQNLEHDCSDETFYLEHIVRHDREKIHLYNTCHQAEFEDFVVANKVILETSIRVGEYETFPGAVYQVWFEDGMIVLTSQFHNKTQHLFYQLRD